MISSRCLVWNSGQAIWPAAEACRLNHARREETRILTFGSDSYQSATRVRMPKLVFADKSGAAKVAAGHAWQDGRGGLSHHGGQTVSTAEQAFL